MVLLICLLASTFLIALDATSVILTISVSRHYCFCNNGTDGVAQSIARDLGGDATESFWIGSSYLLAMCISQPILSSMSQLYGRKSIILLSTLLVGTGSLISADSNAMAFFLAGRTIQGLGAGGLTVLSYTTYGSLEKAAANKFLVGMSCSIALGTICGPLVGAVLNGGSDWVSSAHPGKCCTQTALTSVAMAFPT